MVPKLGFHQDLLMCPMFLEHDLIGRSDRLDQEPTNILIQTNGLNRLNQKLLKIGKNRKLVQKSQVELV